MATEDIVGGAVRPTEVALARQALLQDANAVAAVVTLGIDAEMRGDVAAARRFFGYAQKLTRRDQRTQSWLIEDYSLRRQDIAGALHQYDIALRGIPRLAETLYPVLGAASANAGVRKELVKTLAQRPVWAPTFIDFVANSNAIDATTSASLMAALRQSHVPVSQTAQNRVINALVNAGNLEEAWHYYALFHPGVTRARSRDPKFAGAGDNPSQFDWVPVSDTSITTNITGGIFDFAVSASVGGVLLRQLQLLPAGTYRLSGHTSGIDQPNEARPYWTLTCRDGRELGRVDLPNSSTNGGRFASIVTIPSKCPIQLLSLVARPSDSIGGLTGQIDRVDLTAL
ncbi:hypothetical protein [Sphingomonas paucimobilis]|uniref:Uncharacterized protein n=1 Tax=Sphingomonas paucimobilis TaxID=13689 RepID=A0A7Y2KL63_SPHPI|nr:hypothetical protein [Sphingomonas paucimobilis]MCM3681731.1 hypothetical protein [Sphingomonas paucimobilis]NNG55999.1 hypothetical protein [Sphingomonas paucimobilis]